MYICKYFYRLHSQQLPPNTRSVLHLSHKVKVITWTTGQHFTGECKAHDLQYPAKIPPVHPSCLASRVNPVLLHAAAD